MAYIYNQNAYNSPNNNYNNDRYEDDEDEIVPDKNKKKKEKKTLNKLLTHVVLILTTLLLALSTFSIVSYCLYDEDMQTNMKQSLKQESDIFYVEDAIDSETMAKMQVFIENLPDAYRDSIKQDWIIVLASKVPSELFHQHFVSINDYDTSGMIIGGYTFSQSRIVYVNSTTESDVIYSSFVHEIGHVISFEGATQHGTKAWEDIYRKYLIEHNNAVDYNSSNEAEFFAGCFERYFNDTEKFKTECLDAYNFIENVLDEDIKNKTFTERFFMGCKNTFNTLRVYYYFYFVDGQSQVNDDTPVEIPTTVISSEVVSTNS